MPRASLLTNNRLPGLYKGLDHHYKDYINAHPEATLDQLHVELTDGMYYYLRQLCQSDNVDFNTLSEDEKQKAYAVVKTYLSASPLFLDSPYSFSRMPATEANVVYTYHHHHHYRSYNDDFFFHFWLFQLDGPSNTTSGDSLAQLALFLVLMVAIILAAIAFYYLVNEMVDNIERFCCNEGMLQATLSFFNVAANVAAFAVLAQVYATAPLTNLALAAGVCNPVGASILGVICLTYIGAALGYFVSNKLVQSATAPSASQTLYRKDPHRFNVTSAEEEALLAKGIDPLKVKCAIIALREDMGNEGASAFWNSRSSAAQRNLDLIRQLRRGETSLVQVAVMKFDCRCDDEVILKSQASPTVLASAPPANEDDDVWCGSRFA